MQAAQLIVEQWEKIEIYDLCFPDVQCHSNIYVDFDSIRHRREETARQRYPFGERSEMKLKSNVRRGAEGNNLWSSNILWQLIKARVDSECWSKI